MEKNDKVWVPKEYKKQEKIFFYIPKIDRPVTTRELKYFIPGAVFSVFFFLLTAALGDQFLIPRAAFCITFPFILVAFSHHKEDGMYIEDKIMKKLNYKRKSGVMLNERALKSMESHKK